MTDTLGIEVGTYTLEDELSDEELFCLQGCGSYKQYYVMRQGFEEKRCVFCRVDRQLNQILVENPYVQAWKVPFPKKGLLHQFLICPKRHVRSPLDLSEEESWAIWWAHNELARKYDFQGGMFFARFGDMRLNAGTVPHLHWNLWVPDGACEIRIPLIKDPQDRAKNVKRAQEFALRYELGEVPAG